VEAVKMEIIFTIWLRNVKRYLRSKSRIFGSLGIPVFFLVVMGFGLDSIVQIPGMQENYVSFIIPPAAASRRRASRDVLRAIPRTRIRFIDCK